MVDSSDATKRISDRVAGIEPQKIRLLYDLATEYESSESVDDLVHLEFGEPDFDTPEHAIEAADAAARSGETNYTPNAGLFELRAAIADSIERETGRSIDPDGEVVVTTGGVEALFLSMLAIADPGEEIVIPAPAWPNTVSQAKLASAEPVIVDLPAEEGFDLDPDAMIEAMTDRTRAVVLTSPSNPTGRVFDLDAMERVVEAAASHDAYVIADEVYRRIVYDRAPRSLAASTAHPDRVLTIGSVSKTYAMTGWRVGWVSGPPDVLEEITKIHESTTSCVSTPAQHAAIAALTGPEAPVEEMLAAFERRREYVLDRIEAIPAIDCADPEGAFYIFLDVSALEGSSMDVAKRLLYEYHVVSAPGIAFGDVGDEYLRLSFANGLDRLQTGFDRLERMVENEQ